MKPYIFKKEMYLYWDGGVKVEDLDGMGEIHMSISPGEGSQEHLKLGVPRHRGFIGFI